MTRAKDGVAVSIAIAANTMIFEIDFFRTPVLIRHKRLLRERPARDVPHIPFSSSIKETVPAWTFPLFCR